MKEPIGTARDGKRKRPRGQALWRATLLAALVAAIALFLRFGGWGIGLGSGHGKGDGSGQAGSAAQAPTRCELKLTAKGLFVDGKPSTRDAAVEACKAAGGANVVVTGDALHGDWLDLEQALQTAHVVFYRRGD